MIQLETTISRNSENVVKKCFKLAIQNDLRFVP